MKDTKKNKKSRGLYTEGQLNRLVDSLIHPLFKKSKGFVFIDGLLHGYVEQNPKVSMKKFIRYNAPELWKSKATKPPAVSRRGRKRHYHCTLPLRDRHIVCQNKRAGAKCLKRGSWRSKCPRLIISYR